MFDLRPLCDSQQTTTLGLGVGCVADSCFGGYSGGETPGLIPNPEAKPSSADGTALGRVWESRTPPDLTYSRGPSPWGWPSTAFLRTGPSSVGWARAGLAPAPDGRAGAGTTLCRNDLVPERPCAGTTCP